MPDLPTDPAAVERLVRGKLVELFAALPDLPHVYGARVYVDDENEMVRRFGFTHPSSGRTEMRALMIDFAGFEDTDRGCPDDPVYKLLYDLKLVTSYAGPRPDSSTSTDDFARIVMKMRETVLTNRRLGYERLYLLNLVTRSVVAVERDIETLVLGHIGRFALGVEVLPYG